MSHFHPSQELMLMAIGACAAICLAVILIRLCLSWVELSAKERFEEREQIVESLLSTMAVVEAGTSVFYNKIWICQIQDGKKKYKLITPEIGRSIAMFHKFPEK